MDLARFWRHVVMSPAGAARAFPAATLEAVQREVSAQEARHRGEVCVVVEAELSTAQLWAGLTSRERARELFAARGVWNTEENNGVLIYVMLADHKVEIVADRGIAARTGQPQWDEVCRMVEGHFAAGRFEQGLIEGVRAVSELLVRHFPGDGSRRNELPDRPAMI
jgi:uncharacterized membrane protein